MFQTSPFKRVDRTEAYANIDQMFQTVNVSTSVGKCKGGMTSGFSHPFIDIRSLVFRDQSVSFYRKGMFKVRQHFYVMSLKKVKE